MTASARAVVTFTPTEWAAIEAEAAARKLRRRHGRTVEGASTTAGEVRSVAAEVALTAAVTGSTVTGLLMAGRPDKSPGWTVERNGVRLRAQGTDRPGHLVIRARYVRANRYVLAHVANAERTVHLVGWTDAGTVKAAPTREHEQADGSKVVSHWLPVGSLRPMAALWRDLSLPARSGDADADIEADVWLAVAEPSVPPTPKADPPEPTPVPTVSQSRLL